jgi:hypothetical protein
MEHLSERFDLIPSIPPEIIERLLKLRSNEDIDYPIGDLVVASRTQPPQYQISLVLGLPHSHRKRGG